MAKASPIKIRKHAPYRKSFLIPLWALQLAFSLTILIYAGMNFGFYAFTESGNYYLEQSRALVIIHFLLNLFLALSVIFVIIKFSIYTLSTELFKIQSIVAVVLSGICTVMFLATPSTVNWFFYILSGTEWLASITICARVCVLRKRVQRGEAAEMKRRMKEVDGEEVKLEEVKLEDGNKFRGVEREGVELEDGNKFRGVESEVAIMSVAHHGPRLP